MDSKNNQLLPCPFCGGKGMMKINAQTLNCSVNCAECGVFMKRNFKGHKRIEEVLIELMAQDWNRRIYGQD